MYVLRGTKIVRNNIPKRITCERNAPNLIEREDLPLICSQKAAGGT